MKRTEKYYEIKAELEKTKTHQSSMYGDDSPYTMKDRLKLIGVIDNLEANLKAEPTFLEVGDEVSYHGYSDIEPYKVIEVNKTGKKVKLQKMKAELSPDWKPNIEPGGFSGHCMNNHDQEWNITEDPDGSILEISLRKVKSRNPNTTVEHFNLWMPKGVSATGKPSPISLGAKKFYDYNF